MIFKTRKEKKYTFIDKGEGHPIVLLHGLMGGLSNFEKMMEYFSSEGFRILFPQLPIYDLSVLNTNLTSISKYVIRFVEDQIQEPVTLVGNSMGGHVGLITALERPDIVKNLVLTGSSGLYERAFGDSFPRKSDKEYIRRKTEEVFYDPATATDELVDEVFGVVNDRGKGIKTVMLARSAIKHNMERDMPNIKTPTCLIWGKQDNVTPPDVAETMHKLIPNSDLYWIDRCGHAAMMERPDEFNRILHNWLKDKV
ncbi:MAG: alpha/beta hydrolase [Chryseobacterium sp.]|nr:MAG: alpha/beta hydrolase [Chryseobacterium sp.]